MGRNVLVLKHFEAPRDAGVYFRLVCLTGPSKGESYVLTGNRIVIGRGDKTDIKLNDTKSSREHAEVSRAGDNWFITDLGSQNGIVVNDKKVTQGQLAEGDKIIIGATVFKFARVEVAKKSGLSGRGGEDSDGSSAGSKSMMPILILAVVFGAAMLFTDDKPKSNVSNKPQARAFEDVTTEYSAQTKKRMAGETKQLKEKLNSIYQRGLREYREQNYFRAIHEFNLALIIAPGDAQAEYYLRKTKEDLDRSIEGYMARSQRDEESLKYQSSIVSYCAIIRLLYSVPEDPRHKNAEKKIKELEGKLGIETGETDCLKKQRTSQ
jgi:pSer/pThr/pTyr-binding forkhead associated (FHA) protein